ncbi:MAG: hypothetical protein LBV04_09985 [Deferribacteraceae bacterium]|jgi:KDO2-lipid IV(A) lauroyltransferase|nr:hypothetical protein [Deferribacteraceae bacterium]
MYWLLKGLTAFLHKLSLPNVQKFGAFIGLLAWYTMPGRRKVAKINAEVVGAADPAKTAKESFKHSFTSFLETVFIGIVDQQFIDKYVTIEDKHYYDDLVAQGQSFAFVSGHIGSWDLVSPVATLAWDMKLITVGRMTNSKGMNRFIDDLRNATDRIVYIQQFGYLEKLNDYVSRGYIPGSLLDHIGTPRDSFFAPFFGMEVETLAGMAVFCARRKIPMLPCYLLRTANGFVLRPSKPIWPDRDLKPKERIHDLLVKMNQEFEKIIKEHPEQWFLMHRRFKRIKKDADGKTSSSLYR